MEFIYIVSYIELDINQEESEIGLDEKDTDTYYVDHQSDGNVVLEDMLTSAVSYAYPVHVKLEKSHKQH